MDQGAWPLPNAANIKKYRRAAEQGSAPAQLYVSMMYNSGYGVPQNHAEAVKWLLKAVEQDLAPAQNNLGGMYNSGLGVPPDYAEAAKWFRKAAVQKASFHGLRTSAIGHERKFEPRTLMEKLPK